MASYIDVLKAQNPAALESASSSATSTISQ